MNDVFHFQRKIFPFAETVDMLRQSIQSGRCRNFTFFFQEVRSDTLPVFLFCFDGLFHILRLYVDCNSQILQRIFQ